MFTIDELITIRDSLQRTAASAEAKAELLHCTPEEKLELQLRADNARIVIHKINETRVGEIR